MVNHSPLDQSHGYTRQRYTRVLTGLNGCRHIDNETLSQETKWAFVYSSQDHSGLYRQQGFSGGFKGGGRWERPPLIGSEFFFQ